MTSCCRPAASARSAGNPWCERSRIASAPSCAQRRYQFADEHGGRFGVETKETEPIFRIRGHADQPQPHAPGCQETGRLHARERFSIGRPQIGQQQRIARRGAVVHQNLRPIAHPRAVACHGRIATGRIEQPVHPCPFGDVAQPL